MKKKEIQKERFLLNLSGAVCWGIIIGQLFVFAWLIIDFVSLSINL